MRIFRWHDPDAAEFRKRFENEHDWIAHVAEGEALVVHWVDTETVELDSGSLVAGSEPAPRPRKKKRPKPHKKKRRARAST